MEESVLYFFGQIIFVVGLLSTIGCTAAFILCPRFVQPEKSNKLVGDLKGNTKVFASLALIGLIVMAFA